MSAARVLIKVTSLFPNKVKFWLFKSFAAKQDFVLTNVQGPRKTIYFFNAEVFHVRAWSSGFTSLSFLVSTYNNETQVQISTDTSCGLSSKVLTERLEKIIDEAILKYAEYAPK